ncbi:MAG: aminoacyl-tRNA hydrolase [Candidatus Edwardsbacteria bacterium]
MRKNNGPIDTCLVGLGNPGRKYRNTRHNLGFRVTDLIASRLKVKLKKEKKYHLAQRGNFILAQPTTYMNASGLAVKKLIEKLKLDPNKILIICDDIHLPLGKIRLRKGGSDGGHQGLASIIREIGTQDFPRLRLGIGQPPPGEDLVEYVLSDFLSAEKETVEELIKRGAEAALCFTEHGIEETMNCYNR